MINFELLAKCLAGRWLLVENLLNIPVNLSYEVIEIPNVSQITDIFISRELPDGTSLLYV